MLAIFTTIMSQLFEGKPNKRVETNRRPALPFDAGSQFDTAACAPRLPSAAVAHPFRWAARRAAPETFAASRFCAFGLSGYCSLAGAGHIRLFGLIDF
jgi:hypothetical protein